VTALVLAVKAALVAPAGTVTLPGTLAAAELLDNATSDPPTGAALVNVTVACEAAPPVTLVGFSTNALRLAGGGTGVTVSVLVLLVPL
jgi:hypothetical protein